MTTIKKEATTLEKKTYPRYVAFFDILGFKNIITTQGTIKAAEILGKLSNYLNAKGDGHSVFAEKSEVKSTIEFKIFSDSIFLYSVDDSLKSWRLFTYAICSFFHHALIKNIPIKGGIAYGEVFIGSHNTKDIMCGIAITDAYLIQEDLQYIGIVVHHTLEKHIEKTIKRDESKFKEDEYLKDRQNFDKVILLYKEILTPLRSGNYNHCNINIFKFTANWVGNFAKESESILNDFKLESSGNSRKYIDNTKKVWEEFMK